MRMIDVEDLERKMEQKKDGLLLLDARSDAAFEKEHIPHAKSAPETALRERVEGVVAKDAEIIVYCTDPDCKASQKAGQRLEEMGYENVSRYAGGIEGWKQSGHDTVSS